ncbi:MAG TPA: hypothetical protein PLH02_05155 [Bacillota bacterium]|nr:hypothetical protein [Bacillota bacterium]HPJ86153.1 hypothetical protein [Bacillota bacterium]HPQ62236.1 hypothetical protein [Bacillota bacterium]HRX91631.1 hypothetical protein [Candidatus Izemoplasmatales bacterium]
MKKKHIVVSPFQQYRQSLSSESNELLTDFFASFDEHVLLPEKGKSEMRSDFEKAILYFDSLGVRLDKSLERLDTKNLGGFYSRPAIRWFPLDTAAKIYPLSMRRNQMAVFRLSAYMKETVNPEILQIALSFTIKRFPCFSTTIKKGFFWHYLDTTKRRFVVEKEYDIPCRPLDVSLSGSQTFRLLYHENRISVEIFHILADGYGGMVFLKTLVAEYLRLQGIDITYDKTILPINETPVDGEMSDAFFFVEPKNKASGFLNRPSVQLSGSLSRTKPCRVLHFIMDTDKLKAVAKSKNSTITSYLVANMMLAGKSATDEPSGSMSIQVPVDMRKYYPSGTLRNFSLYCGIKLPLTKITDCESILPEISRQLVEKGALGPMNEMMNAAKGLVRSLRFVPLFIKNPVARIIYGFLGDQAFSNTLSNLGIVNLPEEMASHVVGFDFLLGTSITNRVSCSVVSYNNKTTFSIAKLTLDPSYEETMYKLLKSDGIDVIVEGSGIYGS